MHLRSMDVVECPDGFQFHHDFARHKKIGDILANDDAFVADCNRILLGDREACATQLVGKSIFVDFLDKAGAKDIADNKGAADDFVSDLIQSVFIGVYRRFH